MKVLIVDDDPVVSDYLSQACEARDVSDVHIAASGEEALGLVLQDTYDLITLDIRMPGVSGLEILSPVRDMSPHAVIAIISGYIPEGSSAGFAGCADLVLHKPVQLGVLNRLLDVAERISQAMDEVRGLDESGEDGSG